MEALRAPTRGLAPSALFSELRASRSQVNFRWTAPDPELRRSCSFAPARRIHVAAKSGVREFHGSVIEAAGLRFAVVAARFNDIVTKPLLAGALETFNKYGVKEEHVEVYWVPGSFEIPILAQTLGKSGKYDAILCIGAVVRGATSHYDAVANSAASGIMSASLNTGVPCIFGVLTCDSMEQAFDRAGGKVGNKGGEAALTAIEMAHLLKQHKS